MSYPFFPDADFILKARLDLLPGVKAFFASGSNPDLSSGSSDVWPLGGTYSFLTIPKELYVSSDNILDTTQTITLTLLDEDWHEVIVEVSLNGQTGVLVPGGPFIRGNFAINFTPGENPYLGNIYIGTELIPVLGIPTIPNTVIYVRKEAQVSEQVIKSVPAGHTMYTYQWEASVGKLNGATITARFREGGGTFKGTRSLQLYQEVIQTDLPWLFIPEKGDVIMEAVTSDSNVNIVASVDYLVINNTYIKG